MKQRVFYIEWRHNIDSEKMKAVLSFTDANELLDFFAYEDDPLVYFFFVDITDTSVDSFERMVERLGQNSM
jgi:hypothetical protein